MNDDIIRGKRRLTPFYEDIGIRSGNIHHCLKCNSDNILVQLAGYNLICEDCGYRWNWICPDLDDILHKYINNKVDETWILLKREVFYAKKV